MRDYSIIKKSGEWYNAKATDSFGVEHQNYFETEQESINWIYYIWATDEKPPLTHEEEMEMLATAIWGCTKLDKELGLLKGNQDNLD
jgi:hypothetical protein